MKAHLPDRPWRFAAAALLIMVFLLSCNSSSQKLLEEAESNWRKGRNLEALQGNEALYQREPKGKFAARALLNAADIHYLNLRQLKPAIQFYDKLVDEFPASPEAVEAHRHLAEIYANELNDRDQAIVQYDALLKDPNLKDRGEIQFRRADAFFKKEDYDRALRELRALEEATGDDRLADQVSLKIGSIYQIQKEFDKAVEPFAKVVPSRYPECRRRAILSLAEVYETLFDFDNAIKTIQKLDRTPENEQLVAGEVARLNKKHAAVDRGSSLNFMRGVPVTKK
jgi:tetratricopeptide (TPR) repeat protein